MNITLLFSIIALMLLGAFILGIFIGHTYFTNKMPEETIPKDTTNKEVFKKITAKRENSKSNTIQNNSADSLDLDDYRPGVRIKARLARDRAGSLPQGFDPDNNSTSLDFNRIGTGDKKNPDNLEQIEGIGPHFAKKLHEIGIYNFEQIVAMNDQDLKIIASQIGFFFNRIKRENWQAQARDLVKNKK